MKETYAATSFEKDKGKIKINFVTQLYMYALSTTKIIKCIFNQQTSQCITLVIFK